MARDCPRPGATQGLAAAQVTEAHDNAVRSAIKDQETAGVDIITDGELRRETMVNFFSMRIHGFDMAGKMKPIGNLDPSIQMLDPDRARKGAAQRGLGMDEHFRFLRQFAATAPRCASPDRRCSPSGRPTSSIPSDKELVFDLTDILNVELKGLVAAGCDFIQIDEPVWVGYPQDMPWLVESFNRLVDGVKAKIALHVCYGNYQLKKLFTGQYGAALPGHSGDARGPDQPGIRRVGRRRAGTVQEVPDGQGDRRRCDRCEGDGGGNA